MNIIVIKNKENTILVERERDMKGEGLIGYLEALEIN
jgi:hypothetical protein